MSSRQSNREKKGLKPVKVRGGIPDDVRRRERLSTSGSTARVARRFVALLVVESTIYSVRVKRASSNPELVPQLRPQNNKKSALKNLRLISQTNFLDSFLDFRHRPWIRRCEIFAMPRKRC